MNFDYTFIDGVTVPLKVVISSHIETLVIGDVKEPRRTITVNAFKREHFINGDTELPIDSSEMLQTSELISAVFRKLKEVTSEEFEKTPAIGIKYCPPKEEK